MWAGVECTINRVQNLHMNQCEKSGHHQRLEDLNLFAQLGVERLRYPCLWETVAPHRPHERDWSWVDERLTTLNSLGVKPIVTLLHHGSGPSYTHLLDPEFPELFSHYARAFAERFPWVTDYTPINEPLTTARFSCLYGLWYPHLKDDGAFARALFHQIKASLLAMAEIRAVNPRARLIQTEDLGWAQSTPSLTEQCEFENDRRWLTFDLLTGRMNATHTLYGFLADTGWTEVEFDWLQRHVRSPDILGLNHYLLSNRFLDERLELYPSALHGGNGRQNYVDVAAVDSADVTVPLPEVVLRETWQRYNLPLAVTEVHVRGHRDAQLRWLKEMWTAGEKLQAEGVDLRAVTAWSLLGTYDWNSLCTNCDHFYEPGVFDLRTPDRAPKATALSKMVSALARTGTFDHPVLGDFGWWRRTPLNSKRPPLLITGATGTLGQAFARICEQRGLSYRLLNRAQMDIANSESVRSALETHKPWAVINTAGFVRVDEAEREIERCFRENVTGPVMMAQACAELKIPLLTFSSDLVFDGSLSEPYTESHPVSPLSVYGRSKAESESSVLSHHPGALVIRTSAFFGPWDQANFVTQSLCQLLRGTPVTAATDVQVSPTYVPDLVHTCLDLLIDGEHGLLHLTNQGRTSWSELARAAAGLAAQHHLHLSLNPHLIVERTLAELALAAPRPLHSVLTSEWLKVLPPLDDALDRYTRELDTQILWRSS